MKTYDKFFVGGRWLASKGRTLADVVNPASEKVIGRIAMGNADDVAGAVEAASAAFDGWANTPPAERAAWLMKIQAELQTRAEEIAQLISAEVGTPIEFSRVAQAGLPIGSFGIAAQLLSDYAFSETVGNSEVVREPVGVVACITPWNYPLHQIAAKVAPALAAGCTVVLKPSEVAPLNAFLLAEVIESVGLPAGVFNLVCGVGSVVGEALARHSKVDMVSFTGSTRAGKRVAELASQTVKRVALELGGKSANILLDDADFSRAIPGSIQACYQNAGQTCTAHTRLLVSEARYEEAAALAAEAARQVRMGDPLAADTNLGPLVSEMQRERVRGFIEKGIEEGAELLAGGAEPPEDLPVGYYVKPTVFGRVTSNMTIAREEIFGPVLSILTYRDEDDAVRIANDSVYGLGGGVWSADVESAKRVARRIRTGQVEINGGGFNLMAPFGGYKQSGNGRELGKFGFEEYLEYKSMQMPQR
ncbi:aldehyde dehydrogenase family protein [Ralstonia chuxiongensis]|uniref:aldehyde dehydrogenase family protein n=1 Tax=Ralstonia chuxiongensis TaxID=2957504 RepID=UPI0028F62A65|nr:aldehyde dehydrogenase family protein [Ralstonia chuxiongensis]CAJ0772884.1 3-succinoylsemialdehyde-pyridine dehydrogenase [Ralstonia chuxiongensis]